MTTLILLRHGFSLYNKERRYTGQRDIPLEPEGYRQAEDAARYLLEHYNVGAVYASDLSRAVLTAKPLADALGLPIHTTPAFREIDLGIWTDMLIDDVKAKYPDEAAYFRSGYGYARAGGGENYAEMIGRVDLAARQIARRHPNKTVLIASHGGAIRAALTGWLGIDIENVNNAPFSGNASINVVDFEDGRFTPRIIGFTGHLTVRPDAPKSE